ncbi:hypothetical protein [Priestia megaterium]|uniref:hypothetical protein n=1 Tax=Priestia megaterium TaxID=1404 RepID=UPI00300B9696
MAQNIEIHTVIKETELEEKLYPMRKNWHLLKPYLDDKDVQAILNEAMIDFCEQHPQWDGKMWTPGDAPWEYTTRVHWVEAIDEKMENDQQYQKKSETLSNKLFYKMYGEDADAKDDGLWDDLYNSDEYHNHWNMLYSKYYKEHSPKKGTMEWYQLFAGCHWINQFTAALISKALNVEVDVMTSDKHSVAVFVKDDTIYHADILNEWDSLKELYDFMGEEIDFYSVFDEIE